MENGIYINLPEEEYHNIERLSASHLKPLSHSPAYFWEQSWLNKNKPEPEKKEYYDFGSAVHKVMLEGAEAFEDSFKPAFDISHLDNVLKTCDDMKKFMDENCITYLKSSSKPKLISILNEHKGKLDFNIYDEFREEYDSDKRIELSKMQYIKIDNIIKALDLKNKESKFCKIFSDGIDEVSILFEIAGIKFKARIDYLKPYEIIDIKTFTPFDGKMPYQVINESIAKRDYGLQARLYIYAVNEAKRLVKKGKIFGANKKQEKILKELSLNKKDNDFNFIFISSGFAPIVQVKKFMQESEYCSLSNSKIQYGLKKYMEYSQKFKAGEPWVEMLEDSPIDDSELPVWTFR